MDTNEDLDALLIKSLALLEWRLKRLEFVLGGAADGKEQQQQNKNKQDDDSKLPILARVEQLERRWQKLAKDKPDVGRMVNFYGQHKALLSTTTTSTTSDGADLDASALPTEMQLATVTAMGGQVSKAASQLQALELPFPDTGPLARLAELSPLMAVLADRQTAQALEISELRKRSMMAVSRYKKVHVEGQRDVWREWGATLGAWERTAAREEKRRAKEGE